MSNQRERFHQILDQFDNAMLISRAEDGQIHARPMKVAEVAADDDLWFVTNANSTKIDEIKKDSRVCVACQSEHRFVAISGRASISRDQAKIDDLWREVWRVWFPVGALSPEIRLVRVSSHDGEYWDYSQSQLQAVQYLCETSSQQERTTGDEIHAKVSLHS